MTLTPAASLHPAPVAEAATLASTVGTSGAAVGPVGAPLGIEEQSW